jgi:transposase InsO family protein
VIGWGWFFLSTVLDDYSRRILSWKLFTTMNAEDVQESLDMAIAETGTDQVIVKHRPRLLSDNGPCYVSGELKKYLKTREMDHTRGAPYHPQTQGKIERYHRSMKNVIKLDNYYLPGDLEQEIAKWVNHYNNERLHESLDNVTPADMYFGRKEKILTKRDIIKEKTLQMRKQKNMKSQHQEVFA